MTVKDGNGILQGLFVLTLFIVVGIVKIAVHAIKKIHGQLISR